MLDTNFVKMILKYLNIYIVKGISSFRRIFQNVVFRDVNSISQQQKVFFLISRSE